MNKNGCEKGYGIIIDSMTVNISRKVKNIDLDRYFTSLWQVVWKELSFQKVESHFFQDPSQLNVAP